MYELKSMEKYREKPFTVLLGIHLSRLPLQCPIILYIECFLHDPFFIFLLSPVDTGLVKANQTMNASRSDGGCIKDAAF